MSAEEDNFDIDIYGDGGGEEYQDEDGQAGHVSHEQTETPDVDASTIPPESNQEAPKSATEPPNEGSPSGDSHQIGSTDTWDHKALQAPKQAPQAQGLKRKEGADDRPQDPGATSALFLSELHWWITDDDIRGWANQCECEDEMQEVTFSEHKVNGKSKGQAYALFTSAQAATAVKRKIESFGEGQVYKSKFTVTFSNPFLNPFKTLPKDGNNRNNNQMSRNYNSVQGQSGYNQGGSYRGGRGSYNSRGGANMGGYSRGGFQQPQPQPLPGSYQGGAGFQGGGAMGGGMPSYGNFQGRGGMMGGGGMRGGNMGMRGGRGGGMNNMGMGMPMGMGPMPGQMAMGMPQMNAGMGMQGMHPHSTFATSGFLVSPPVVALPLNRAASPSAEPVVGKHKKKKSPRQSSASAESTAAFPGAYKSPLRWLTPSSRTNLSVPSVSAVVHPTTSSTTTATANRTASNPPLGFPNPGFFPQQQDANWNPHGAKRTRQE